MRKAIDKDMIMGAIIGDIVGSRFEFYNHRSKDGFELFDSECFFTDDTVCTLAVAEAIGTILKEDITGNIDMMEVVADSMKELCHQYPDAGYGMRFTKWLYSRNPKPYFSCGNGAAMRISPVAYFSENLWSALILSDIVTNITHNHPESLKAARAVTEAIYMAQKGLHISTIQKGLMRKYYPDWNSTLDEIRPYNKFDETCQVTVPQALQAFFESTSFEDAIRNAISIGGDSDTIAAITGSIAGAYYGIPCEMRKTALSYLDDNLRQIYESI